jgi:cysteine desulfurase
MRVYFDNAATTPISNEVIEVMTSCLKDHYGNPSSIHADGRRVRAALEEARKTVAQCIGASIGEIFFTSGGTESNNMALKCAVRDLGVTRIISSPTEHHCILHTLENLAQHHNIKVEYLEVCPKGKASLEELEELLATSAEPTLVSLMHANNEIGTMLDLDKVANICAQYNAFFHSDTVQTIGHFPIDVDKTKIHFLAGAAHKFHGPKGVGFIYINGDVSIKPFIDGGAQERNMRGGTENVYGIVGLAKALELYASQMEERKKHIEGIRDYMSDELIENFQDIHFNGDIEGPRLYTVLSVSFPASPKSEMMLLSLDISGISASGGSACSSGAETGSHVMQATNAEVGRKTIRFSFSHYNTKEEVDFVVEKLKSIVAQPIKVSAAQ